jgi:Tfp pilus assembly protein PilN
MIKINLATERKQVKAKTRTAAVRSTGNLSPVQSLALLAIMLIGVAVAAGWWWTLSRDLAEWRGKIEDAEKELTRLAEVRKKGDQFETQKKLLSRKIDLITQLKKQQAVPVHILDQVSENLPEFLWLDSMSANDNKINISGKATTYTAVSNFYSNLTASGFFHDVSLGKTFEVPEGVSFSLTCQFSEQALAPAEEPAS